MKVRAILVVSIVSVLLGACGESNPTEDNVAQRQEFMMTLGGRNYVSKPYGAPAPRGDADWTTYDPPATFSASKAIPLQYITMDDGVKIAVKVTLPSNDSAISEGPFPVILVQTAYSVSVGSFVPLFGGVDPYMTSHGYATVTVDVRGTGNSQGEWESFGEREQKDYFQVVDWAASQPWSDGRIGLYGASYLGITAVLTAQSQHPAIKAAFPIVPLGDVYRDIGFSGGQANPTFLPIWLSFVTGVSVFPLEGAATDPEAAVTALISHIKGAATNF